MDKCFKSVINGWPDISDINLHSSILFSLLSIILNLQETFRSGTSLSPIYELQSIESTHLSANEKY